LQQMIPPKRNPIPDVRPTIPESDHPPSTPLVGRTVRTCARSTPSQQGKRDGTRAWTQNPRVQAGDVESAGSPLTPHASLFERANFPVFGSREFRQQVSDMSRLSGRERREIWLFPCPFPAVFPVIREFSRGARFDTDCLHHQSKSRTLPQEASAHTPEQLGTRSPLGRKPFGQGTQPLI
jgi:hypothetical protein